MKKNRLGWKVLKLSYVQEMTASSKPGGSTKLAYYRSSYNVRNGDKENIKKSNPLYVKLEVASKCKNDRNNFDTIFIYFFNLKNGNWQLSNKIRCLGISLSM